MRRCGYRAALMLPLTIDGKPVGVLALNASEPDFFGAEEMKLLTELARDVSFALDHIQKEERLNYLAYYDELTGLPNRTLFCDRTNQLLHALKKGASAALVVLDLDRFRVINESFGRHAGDEILRQVAQRLSSGRGSGRSTWRASAATPLLRCWAISAMMRTWCTFWKSG